MKNDNKQIENKELKVLGTHAAGATDLFETRRTENVVSINAPEEHGTTGSTTE